jgi:hypothetical protein
MKYLFMLLSEIYKPQLHTFDIDEVLAKLGHRVFHSPLYHLDLNIVELILPSVMDSVAAKTTFKLDDRIHVMKEKFASFTLTDWSSRCHLLSELKPHV